MLVMLVNCANGRVLWTHISRGDRRGVWVCRRDQFQIPAPESPSDLDTFIPAILAHSQQLSGAVQSVDQLTL